MSTATSTILFAAVPDDPYSLLLANKRVAEVLRRYFGRFNEMYSVHLVTSYFRFGEENENFYPTGSFVRSRLYSAAEKARGALVWMPTYDYIEMFGLEDIYRTIPLDYRNVFSAVKVLNVSTVRNGTIKSLPLNAERPILVLNFREEFLRTTFLSTTSPSSDFYQNYQMLTKDGHVVSDRDASRLGSSISEVWLDKIGSAASGTILTRTGGKENIVCYSVSDVTGWVSAITVPTSLFTAAILGTASRFVLSIYLLAIIVTAFISFGTSRIITRRIHELLKPIERIGNGEFTTRSSPTRTTFGFFYDKLNAMNENLKTLIHENYVVKLREREAAVHMLNVQLNPHFLYNTINIINWTALRGEASQTSKMLVGLARMLQYTSDKHSEMASLHEDMDWIQRYVYIMKMRFEGLFTLELDIEPGLLELQIPKLLLQPLVEDSIMHGFKGMREGGRVIISGAMEDGRVVLSVEDNGCGMSDEKIRAVMTNPGIHRNRQCRQAGKAPLWRRVRSRNSLGEVKRNHRLSLYALRTGVTAGGLAANQILLSLY